MMVAVQTMTVTDGDGGLRLDRWFRAHFPGVGFGELQKLLRTGQVRIDGKRAKANARLEPGQEIRVPPQVRAGGKVERAKARPKPQPKVSDADVRALKEQVLYRDADMIVIDKPAGLATQGGTGTHKHLDAMLDALRFGAVERPRLVHRLDRDTSGILVLARHRSAAQALTGAFRARGARKIYLAVTAGVPKPRRGKIDLALGKAGGRGREKMVGHAEDAQRAVTLYDVMDSAGGKAALVTLMPLTGRTHQLRAHLAAIGTPILGDGKYGGAAAHVPARGVERRLHLHAYGLEIAKPSGGVLKITAPLPVHMRAALDAFGFESLSEGAAEVDPFPRD